MEQVGNAGRELATTKRGTFTFHAWFPIIMNDREKTRITKLIEGFDFIGFQFVKRRSPKSGKQNIYIFPSKAAQRNIRRRIKCFTKRRTPIAPAVFVEQVNQTVRGWVNYFRHTNASQAFRSLQRFINTRFRRYLNYRSKGRGFGWRKYLNAALCARGMLYIGSCSGKIRGTSYGTPKTATLASY